MKSCILNVATGPKYCRYQDRLLSTLKSVGYTGSLKIWRDRLPKGSPPHEQDPYAFKLFAIDEAIKEGYEILFWCDSGVWFQKHPEPFFDIIQNVGYHFIIGGDQLGNWCSDFSLDLFNITREKVFENKWQLIGGTIYGFNITNPTTQLFLKKWKEYFEIGAFRGSYINNCIKLPDEVRQKKGMKPSGFVSSHPKCFGHRHDETIGSFLVYQLNMKLTWLGGIFQGPIDSPETIAKSGYTME